MLLTWASSRSRPSLVLNFLQGISDPRITYSGGANGTRVNSAGVIVAATAPRFDYDPVTLAAKGLLVEEARTNLRLYSGAIDNVTEWGDNRTSRTGGAITAPDGTASGCLVTADGASNSHYISSATAEGAGVKVNSIFAKVGTQSILQIAVGGTATPYANFDLAGVTATAFGAGTTAGIESYGNGWYRCWMATTDVLANGVRYAFVTSTAAGRLETNTLATTLYLWGAGCEAVSTFPTSYIPTTTASVTRTADSAVMTGTNFSSWYNATESTFVASFDIPYAVPSASGPRVLCTSDSVSESTNGQQVFTIGSTGKICSINSFSSSVNAGRLDAAEASTPNVVIKAAATFALNDRALSVNGVAPVTSAGAAALPIGVDRLYIGGGSGSTTYINGHIQSIAYYPSRMSNEQLQALTA